MALSRQTIQTLVGFLETHLSVRDTHSVHLRLCHHALLREWSRQEHEQFKTRAQNFSRRYKQSRAAERARVN